MSNLKLILMYPTLIIAIISALPTFWNLWLALRMDVPYSDVGQASQQDRLWSENYDCHHDAEFDMVRTPCNTEVGVIICENGNVLLQVKPVDSSPVFRWIDPESFTKGFSIMSMAHAGNTGTTYDNIVCSRYIGSGKVLQKVFQEGIGCIDLIINTYTGEIISSAIAPCDDNCGEVVKKGRKY